MYHNFLIHSSVEEHLGYFHVLAIVNSAAVNIGIHVSLSILVSSGCMHSNCIAGSYGSPIPNFLRNLHTVLHSAVPVCIPAKRGLPFLHTLSSIIVCRLFDDGHSDQHEMIPHCGFDLRFSNNEWCWISFHDMNLSKLWEIVEDSWACCTAVHGIAKN